MRSRWTTLLVGGLLVSFCGCGDSGPAKPKWPDPVKVTGKVTYKGKPFASGNINFVPDASTQGQGGAAVVKESGEYVAEMRGADGKTLQGLIPGKYKVGFSRFKKPDGTYWVMSATEGPASVGAMDEMPLNVSNPAESQFSVEITKDKPTYDFDIP